MAIKVITLKQNEGESSEDWDQRVNDWMAQHDGRILQSLLAFNETGLGKIAFLYEEREELPGPPLRRPAEGDPRSNQEPGKGGTT